MCIDLKEKYNTVIKPLLFSSQFENASKFRFVILFTIYTRTLINTLPFSPVFTHSIQDPIYRGRKLSNGYFRVTLGTISPNPSSWTDWEVDTQLGSHMSLPTIMCVIFGYCACTSTSYRPTLVKILNRRVTTSLNRGPGMVDERNTALELF